MSREWSGGAEWFGAAPRRAVEPKETVTMFSNLVRFFRERKTYWSVVNELSTYSDRELHDLGIDRADVHSIAQLAAKETKA